MDDCCDSLELPSLIHALALLLLMALRCLATLLTALHLTSTAASVLPQSESKPAHHLAKRQQASGCADPAWFSTDSVGALTNYGDEWCDNKWNDGATYISGMNCWGDDKGIHALQFEYSDNSTGELRGRPGGTNTPLTLAPGEMIKSATMYGSGVGDGLGHITLETTGGSSGGSYDCGKSTDGITPYPQDVKGGFLVGAWGNLRTAGWNRGETCDIGFLFLNTAVESVEIADIVYTQDIAGTNHGLEDILLSSTEYANTENNVTTPFRWNGYSTQTTSREFTQSTAAKFGGSVSVTASGEILGLGGSSTYGFTWSVTHTESSSASETNTVTLRWTQQGQNNPGQTSQVKAMAKQGKVSVPYTSTIILHMQDGSQKVYNETGQSSNVLYSEAYVSVLPYADMGGNIGDSGSGSGAGNSTGGSGNSNASGGAPMLGDSGDGNA